MSTIGQKERATQNRIVALFWHYSVALAARRTTVDLPLWVWFIAVQWLDLGFMTFVLLGVEKVRIVQTDEPDSRSLETRLDDLSASMELGSGDDVMGRVYADPATATWLRPAAGGNTVVEWGGGAVPAVGSTWFGPAQ